MARKKRGSLQKKKKRTKVSFQWNTNTPMRLGPGELRELLRGSAWKHAVAVYGTSTGAKGTADRPPTQQRKRLSRRR